MAFFKKFKTTDPKNPILNAYNKLPTGEVVRRHYHFTGIVQGVGFRVEMWRRAMNMHLSGWVRNNFDGSVDAELEGPLPRIEMLIQQMKEILGHLGFVLSAMVQKQRRKYSYQDVTLALDEVEGLGSYVEVEARAEVDIEEQRQKVLRVMNELGLNESIRSSYLELLEEKQHSAAGNSEPI